MASEFVVGLVSLVLVAVPLVFFFWALGRTARHTAQAGPSLFGALGGLLVFVGLLALVWTQLTFNDRHAPGAVRWDVATGPLVVFGIGLIVCVGAQILRVMQQRADREATERSGQTRV